MTSEPDSPRASVDPLVPKRPPSHALVGDDTSDVLDDAVARLLMLRHLEWGDMVAELHALTSLAIQLQLRLPDTVADAIEQGHSWPDVAGQLGVTPGAARRRYGHNLRAALAD